MASIFSATQSISTIGKSMTAIARVEDHLATFMKKVVYFEKFFQRMEPNLPVCVVDTAALLFRRCYEYRDEIRDELESSVAYVVDAGRWVVGLGDWNSKMEKRMNQISELVLLANTLLTEYAVTGEVGAKGCRDELVAYLQILAATVTLRNGPVDRKAKRTSPALDDKQPIAGPHSAKAAEFSSEMSALGTEISGAFSEMFGRNDLGRSAASRTAEQMSRPQGFDTDNDTMNPFAASYQRPDDPYTRNANSAGAGVGASVSSGAQSLPGATVAGANTVSECPLSDGDTPNGPLSPVSLGEYEYLEMDSIPKYAAFKTSAQLAARRQCAPGIGNDSLATSMTSDGGRSAVSESYKDLFPMPPSSKQNVSKSLGSLDTKKKLPKKPILDMNYSYDFQCEVAHNPFFSGNAADSYEGDMSVAGQQTLSSLEQQSTQSANVCANAIQAPSLSPPPVPTLTTPALDQTHTSVSITLDPSVAGTEDGRVPLSPMLHEVGDYTQAQARAAFMNGQATNAQCATLTNTHGQNISTLDAAVRAEHENDDSGHEYNLFGVGKTTSFFVQHVSKSRNDGSTIKRTNEQSTMEVA